MALKLEKMTVEELDDVIAQAQQRKQVAYETMSQQARQRIEAILAETGFTLDELYGNRKRSLEAKSKKPPKFLNPDNSEETWSGYGRMPRWFIDAINAGVSKEDLMVGSARKVRPAAKKARAEVKAGRGYVKAARAPAAAKKVRAGTKVGKGSSKAAKAPKRR